jgi:hypothetical protein
MGEIAARLEQLYREVPFWRERWKAAGFDRAPTGLERLEPVRAADLAADEQRRPPYGGWRVGAAFVRVGVPLLAGPLEMVVFSAADLAREARVGAATLRAAGLCPGWRETNTLPGGLATPGSLIVGDAAQALGALDMPVGAIDAEAPRATAFDFWSRVRPDFAVLDVAGARSLAALLEAKQMTARALGLRAAALVTDARDPEPELPQFDVPLTRIVGLAEAFSLLAVRGPDGVYAVPSDEVIVEVLDGELVLTTLAHCAALVRYAPGVRAERASPAAGGPGFRLL